jgi:hypothetical protein
MAKNAASNKNFKAFSTFQRQLEKKVIATKSRALQHVFEFEKEKVKLDWGVKSSALLAIKIKKTHQENAILLEKPLPELLKTSLKLRNDIRLFSLPFKNSARYFLLETTPLNVREIELNETSFIVLKKFRQKKRSVDAVVNELSARWTDNENWRETAWPNNPIYQQIRSCVAAGFLVSR